MLQRYPQRLRTKQIWKKFKSWSRFFKKAKNFIIRWWWFSHQVVSNTCDPMDHSPQGSSVHGISHPNTSVGCHFLLLGSSPTRDQMQVSCISCIVGRFFTNWAIREAHHQVTSYKMMWKEFFGLKWKDPMVTILATGLWTGLKAIGPYGQLPGQALPLSLTWGTRGRATPIKIVWLH